MINDEERKRIRQALRVHGLDPTKEVNWAVAQQAYELGGAAERESIITLAREMNATVPADHPEGAQASFADYLDVHHEVEELALILRRHTPGMASGDGGDYGMQVARGYAQAAILAGWRKS